MALKFVFPVEVSIVQYIVTNFRTEQRVEFWTKFNGQKSFEFNLVLVWIGVMIPLFLFSYVPRKPITWIRDLEEAQIDPPGRNCPASQPFLIFLVWNKYFIFTALL